MSLPKKGLINRQVLIIAVAAFLAYTSVFAFRKPFTVAQFEGLDVWGFPYLTALVFCQGLGYMVSKFVGIRFISSMGRTGRWKVAVLLISIAWLSLLLFAVLPPWAGLLLLFVNGYCMGFMWGITFSYVEGREVTDLLGAVLAASFIFAGGFTRSVGKFLLLHTSVTEFWMPFVTGAIFLLPFAFFLFLLEKMPPPSAEDVQYRQRRVAMHTTDRKAVMARVGVGLVLSVAVYVLLTVIRDLRDNFMGQMWLELGYNNSSSIFSRTETLISVLVLGVIGAMILIKNNLRAFWISHGLIGLGLVTALVATWLFRNGAISGMWWMQLAGLGLYLGYVPYNSIFFERMVAGFVLKGNIGFFIYLADAFGYLGSLTVMLAKGLLQPQQGWTVFFSQVLMVCTATALVGLAASAIWFWKKARGDR